MVRMGGGEIPDMSEDPDAEKSAKERCIRVAAMDIMASEEDRNIYVDKMTQCQLSWGQKNARHRILLVFPKEIKFSEKLLMYRLDGK